MGTDDSILTSVSNPLTSVGSGYAGWDTYGGPGVKVEYYDRTNGKLWITRAIDMTLRNGSINTNSDSTTKVDDYTYYTLDTAVTIAGAAVQIKTLGLTELATLTTQRIAKVARNGKLTMNNVGVSTNIAFIQLSVAEVTNALTSPLGAEMKYRCLESGGKTCVRSSATTTLGHTWYLDAPMFDHANSGTHRYHDADIGNVTFLLDVVVEDFATKNDTPDTAITAGDTTFTIAGRGAEFVAGDVVLFREAGASPTYYELVQVRSVASDTMTLTTPFANSYTTSDIIKWAFGLYYARAAILCTQVYRPVDDDDRLSVSSYIYRAAKYDMVYAEEVGNLLVYSLLKSGTIYRPITPDMADSVQVTQEVKFIYSEKDFV